MNEQTITCGHCGRLNRVPTGTLVEASCGRCESALTWYTWIAPAVHGGALMRTVQIVAAAAILAALLGPPLADWIESEPFRLTDRPQAASELMTPGNEIAGEALAE